jgi:hypothetical protein
VSLLSSQRDFQDWLTTEASDTAGRFGEQAQPGLAVYLNNYRSQLMGCLAESFPALRAWLGEVEFDGAAATHIDSTPPHSWTLDAYPAGFPATLDELHAAAPQIAELARLELALAAAFVGPDAATLEPSTLSDVDWDSAVIHLVPTFAVLPVSTNVGAIWSAISGQQPVPMPERLPEETRLAIWRTGFTPVFRTVHSTEAAALEQVRQGQTFGEICAALVERHGEVSGTTAAAEILGQWLAGGLIGGVSTRAEDVCEQSA